MKEPLPRMLWLFYLPAPLIWALDRRTKSWADHLFGGTTDTVVPWLEIHVVRNTGSLLGLVPPSNGRFGLAEVGMVLALIALCGWAWRSPPQRSVRHLGVACMIGGAVGNLSDRLMHGYVIDFLQIGRFPIFNLADVALLIGLCLVAGDLLLAEPCRSESAEG